VNELTPDQRLRIGWEGETWADAVRMIASWNGVPGYTLTDDTITNLLWERTAWPVVTDMEYLAPQIIAAVRGETTDD
jgi:hypothetical protein